MKTKMINTHCHGCKQPMQFESKPVVITDMDGERRVYHGKASAVWICKTCRQDPVLFKAARLAAGMPVTPTLPQEFDYDEREESYQTA